MAPSPLPNMDKGVKTLNATDKSENKDPEINDQARIDMEREGSIEDFNRTTFQRSNEGTDEEGQEKMN